MNGDEDRQNDEIVSRRFGGGLFSAEAVRQNADLLGIRWEELPRPPFFSPFLTIPRDKYRVIIAAKVMGITWATGRELTDEEKQAVARATAKRLVTQSWTGPLSLTTASFLAYKSRAGFGFPFYKSAPASLDPHVFPSRRFVWLRGSNAFTAWHALRVGVYLIPSYLLITSCMVLYSRYAMARDMLQDKVSRNLLEEASQRMKGKVETSIGEVKSLRSDMAPAYGEGSAMATWGDGSRSTAPRGQADSQAKAFTSSDFASTPNDDGDSALFEETYPVTLPKKQPQENLGARRDVQRDSQRSSAWDRLRQQALSDQGRENDQAPRPRRWNDYRQHERHSGQDAKGGVLNPESYTYSRLQDEKSKEQAQKEFDALLEQERRGHSGEK